MTVAETETSPLKVLVVDDERPARQGIRALLGSHADVVVVGEASSGQEAIAAIQQLQPSVVFLDVQMPDGNGFDVVRAVGVERMPVVIFATAYDEYALQAFETHAADYLLKPLERARFDEALARARTRVRQTTADERLARLLDAVADRRSYRQRFTVKVGNRMQFVPAAQVDYFEAEANYVRIHVAGKSFLVRESLTALGEQLDPARFLRIQRSLLVNVARIQEVESLYAGEYVLYLTTGRKLTTGRTYRAAIQAALGL